MKAVIAGPDADGLGDELVAAGATVEYVEGHATLESLTDAGVDDAVLLVLTDMGDASAIPVARERNPDLRIVTYARESLPEFARAQTDLAIDPALLAPDVVADELA